MPNLSDLITATSAQELMVQSLKDSGFEGDLTKGSPIYQLLIEPNSVIYAANVAKQDEIKNAWSLLTGQLNTDAAVNITTISNIFNNLRVLPSAGAKSSGKIALTFSTNTTRSLSGTRFISADGSIFTPKLPYTLVPSESSRSNYTASELLYTADTKGYTVEVEIEATLVGVTSIGSGDIFTTTLSGLLSAHAVTSFSGGYSPTSIEDLIKDVPEILSETSMVSPISVVTEIKNNFSQLNEITVFRAGDPEMQRANKNFLGVDSGSADIVLTTSTKPSVTRTRLPGHLELNIDEDGVFWNSNHRIGYAYRQASLIDPEEGINADEILNSYVFVEGRVTDKDFVGAISVIEAGLDHPNTSAATTASADTEVQDNMTILARELLNDNRYGSLPVEGSDPQDFYFSSYQHRIKFEFRTDWADIEVVMPGVYEKVYAWVRYWAVFNQAKSLGGDFTADLTKFAEAFGVTSDKMPTTYRPEVPVYADVVYYEGIAEIQTYINDNSRRCFGQDYIIKNPHVHAVALSITVSRDVNFLRFREDHFKTKIADFISSRGLIHTSPITTEHIKSLIFEEGSDSVNSSFSLIATVTSQRHSGEFEILSGDHIDYFEDVEHGVTARNSILLCSSNNIEIKYL